MKLRVMSLAVFTAAVAMTLAPMRIPLPATIVSLAAIALGAGAAGALNMWYDAAIDARMARTARRPVPAGRLAKSDALMFGLVTAVASILLLAASAGMLAAALLAGTIIFYAVVYTMWLKTRTPQNIVIGGAAGALPPVVGWAAASGSLSWQAGLLFLIIFLWTPPHFWSLALLRANDYAAAGIPMLPNVAGERATRRQIFAYSLLLAPVGLAPALTGMAGTGYGVAAAVLGAVFLERALALLRTPLSTSRRPAKALFGYSIIYLYTIFGALLLDRAWAVLPAG